MVFFVRTFCLEALESYSAFILSPYPPYSMAFFLFFFVFPYMASGEGKNAIKNRMSYFHPPSLPSPPLSLSLFLSLSHSLHPSLFLYPSIFLPLSPSTACLPLSLNYPPFSHPHLSPSLTFNLSPSPSTSPLPLSTHY